MLRLQKLATRHIRKWLNIAKTSTSELLYSERGWALMSLSKLWLHCTAQNLNQMNASRDPAVRHALRIKIENEKRQRSRGHVRPAADLCNIRSTHLTRFVSCPHTGPATYQGCNSPLGHINPHRHQIPAMQDRGTNPKAHSRGCRVALDQGRYTFRHDFILRALAYHVSESPHKALSFRPTWHATPSNVASRQ